MKKKYKINDADWETIMNLNKEGGDRVMYLSGGLPLGSGSSGKFLSLQEKINNLWQQLGKQEGFDWKTIEPIDNREFYAESQGKEEGYEKQ